VRRLAIRLAPALVLLALLQAGACRCQDEGDELPVIVERVDAGKAKPAPVRPEEQRAAARLARAVRAGNARLVALPPGTPSQARNLQQGKALLQAGDKEAAQAHFQAATHGPVTGARVSALLALGDLYREQGRMGECVGTHEEAARIAVGVPEVQLQLGRAYVAAGRTAKGEEALRQAVKLEPRLLAAWVDLGTLLARVGRDAEAAKALLTYERYLFALVEELRVGGEADRLAAVDALALASDEKVVSALVSTLDDPSERVRAAAAEALGDSASTVAGEAIEGKLASERSEEVRTALMQARQRLRAALSRPGGPAASVPAPSPAPTP